MKFNSEKSSHAGSPSLSARAREYLETVRPITLPKGKLSEGVAERVRAERRTLLGEILPALSDQYSLSKYDDVMGGVNVKIIEPPLRRDDTTIVYIHGGAFVFGQPDDTGALLIAHHTERRVVSIKYRLAPEHPFPAGFEDCRAVLRALASENREYAVIGMSAGANLAACAVLAEREHMPRLPQSITLMTPASDFTNFGDSMDFNDGRDPILTWENQLDMALDAYVGDHDITAPSISPIFGNYDAQWPRTLIVTGTRDLLLSSCVRLHRAMRAQQAPVELRVWDGMWHGFNYVYDMPEALECWAEIKAFMG